MIAYLRTTRSFLLRPVELLRGYRREDVQPDLIAGLTVGVVLLPQGLAFSLLAGLPPQMGLYSAVIAAIIGALWGSSSHLHSGPTNTASALVLSTLLPIAAAGSPEFIAAAGLLALLAGLFRLVMGVARLGMLVNFVSDSVAVGFTAGAGILIMAGQLATLLRLPSSTAPDLIGQISSVVTNIGRAHLPSLAIGVATVLLIMLVQRLAPKLSPVLLGIAAVSLGVWLLRLDQGGVQVLGALPGGLPPLAALPLLNLDLIGRLSTGALAIGTIGLVEAAAISRAIASNSGQRLDSNQEFVGQGLANIACGLFSGYPTSGSFNRSALAYRSGGRTAMTGVFSGLFVLAASVVLGPLAAHLPRAALAGALLLTAYGMIDRREIARLRHSGRADLAIMLTTLFCTLLLPLQFAVLIGVLMSLAHYILQTSAPRVQEVLPDAGFKHWVVQPDRPACPQLAVVDVLGDLYFGAVNHVEESLLTLLAQRPSQRFLLLRMHSVQRCDISGIKALESLVRLYRNRGGEIFLVRVREPVLELMRATNFDTFLGRERFLSEDSAIDLLFHRVIDPAVCIYECPVRAFKECQNLPKSESALHIRTNAPTELAPEIEPRALWQRLRQPDPPLLVDVREPREYVQGHLPGAQLIPLGTLLDGRATLPRDQPVVTVCRSGRRSARAAALLRTQGIDASVLRGGVLAWEAADLLTAVGADAQ